MGYIRKALYISTLGLSGLVLDDDTKPPAKASGAKLASAAGRKRKTKTAARATTTTAKTKTKAKAKPAVTGKTRTTATAGAKGPKRKPARSKPPPVSAKPTTARKPPAARAEAQAKPLAGERPTSHTAPPSAPAPASGTVIALERISRLHAHGELSDHEFAAAKARILGTSPAATAPDGSGAAFPAIEANVAAARHLADLADSDRDRSGTIPSGVRGI